jgi:16S rRNA (adenine1518-N6/adenine1519-N6)-dimethyltransferase
MNPSLKKHGLALNKKLGQHFLANESYLQRIVDAAGLNKDSTILEIGPGSGHLTQKIISTGATVVAVEKDTRWSDILQSEIKAKNFHLLNEDILQFKPDRLRQFTSPPYKALGNLPYNIATTVIFHLLDSKELFTDFYFMVQKEVGDRMKAQAGPQGNPKDYGVLSIMVQLYCEVKTLFHIPPGAFVPPPKVQSSLMHLKVHHQPRWEIHDLTLFKKLVTTAFGQRRKTITNSLSPLFPDKKTMSDFFQSLDITPTSRPETLPISSWVTMANHPVFRLRTPVND